MTLLSQTIIASRKNKCKPSLPAHFRLEDAGGVMDFWMTLRELALKLIASKCISAVKSPESEFRSRNLNSYFK